MNFPALLCFLVFLKNINSEIIKINNVTCESLDKSNVEFRSCFLKRMDAGVTAMNIHCELYQVPVKDVTTNVAIFKNENGFHPFLYNFTWDFCAFMKTRKRMPMMKGIAEELSKASNINHTCPYAHDIIVKNWILKDEYLKYFPAPAGEYLIKLKVAVYDDWKAEINTYLTRI